MACTALVDNEIEGRRHMATSNTNRSGSHPDPGPDPLPLRWFVILAAAGASGLAAGTFTEVSFGIGTGIAMIGVLHKILGR
ncbi:hypothetical protein [Nocardia sp. NPDC058705]|uniref:hypothetical protein n=1 Tax=Nocardia sp. NPDC058705 TaxID=3346609 RepID=UPI00367880AD